MNSQFNAIDYAQQLEAVGVPQGQADVHAKMLSLALTSCVASRADLRALDDSLSTRMELYEERIAAKMAQTEAKISARMDQLEAKMELRFARIESDNKLTRWIAATNTAILIAVLVKLYFP
ncbi:MAG: hypothetical protein QFF03_15510 [Pseudomonadota bacterium]|nr:hypothetical protein [Pseudomonadota bacterium]